MKDKLIDIATNPFISPTGFLIKTIATSVIDKTNSNSENQADLEKLALSAKKQVLQMQMAEAQAKVAQEIAIARRIEIAEEVEIEEFYDLSGDACFGVNTQGEDISIGAKANGKKVTKRIYKFKGVNSNIE